MTNTVLENYKLCGGTSAVRLSPDFFFSYSGREERLSTNTRSDVPGTSSRKQPLLNKRTSAPRADYARISYNARMYRIVKKDDAIDYWALFSALQRYNKA